MLSVSTLSYLSLTVPWMEFDNEIYDGWLRAARNCGQQLLYLMQSPVEM